MGARIPPNVRPRRGGIACEFCGRKVPSVEALRSHQTALHSKALKEKGKLKSISTRSIKIQKPEQPKVLKAVKTYPRATPKKIHTDGNVPKTSTITSETDSPKPIAVTSKLKTDISEEKRDVTKSKVAIEEKSMNPAEMQAKQKAATSAKVRKVEYKCPKCDKLFPVLFVAQKHIQKYHSVNSNNEKVSEIVQPILLELCVYCNVKFSKPHQCPNRPDASLLTYNCLGCQQQFKNSKLFDLHVADVHGYPSESLFFPSKEEFLSWKKHMEYQTNCEYILMSKYNSKEIYRCSECSDNHTDDSVVLCPSSIVSKGCPKGLQIDFYTSHYKHHHTKYDLRNQYKTFSVSDLIQQAGSNNSSTDDDLYLQFKTLMETVVLDAAKINIGTLKTLMSRAQNMMSILQEYDEDEEVETANRSTISLNTSSPKPTVKPSEMTRTRKRGLEENNSPAKGTTDEETLGSAKISVKSMGKKSNTFSLADDKDSDKILKELDGDNRNANKESSMSAQSPTFNDTYKNFLMNVTKSGPAYKNNKKKNIVKTKMGQFKGPSPKKVAKSNSIGATKDIDYEVLEQDDDCNILVLKI